MKKICAKCGISKDESEFKSRLNRSGDGTVLRSRCITCEHEDDAAYRERKKAEKLASITWDTSTHSKCETCGEIKELSHFKRTNMYAYKSCKECEDAKKSKEVGYDVTTHRRCTGCNELKVLDEFSKKDGGRDTKCRVCTAENCAAWRAEKVKDPEWMKKERQRGRDKASWKTERGKATRRRRTMRVALSKFSTLIDTETKDRFDKDPRRLTMLWELNKKDKKAYANDRALRNETRQITRNAIERGDIIRQPCEHPGCGAPMNPNGTAIEAHHNDYNNPLDITWYCIPHHGEHHIKLETEKYLNRIKQVDEHFFKLDSEIEDKSKE